MDASELAFDTLDLILLNGAIALMMFGVSLQLRLADFARLLHEPRAPLVGLLAQFLILPALTCLGTWALGVPAELALGMILVASCPGGTFSNVMTWLGRGSVPVSVTMTAFSSVAAVVLTPFNFALYGGLNPATQPLLREIAVPPLELFGLVLLVLGVPIVLGMLAGARFPALAARSDKPMRVISLLIFLVFVALAFKRNAGLLADAMQMVVPLVIAHNAMALSIGALMARAAALPVADRRAVTMEVGIQNSGLGLTLLFTFFPQASGMVLIAACWGIWHLISGLSLAGFWARRPT